MASLIVSVVADFQIYYVEEVTEDADGNSVSNDYLMVPDGAPSCNDVELEYEFFPLFDDASNSGDSRCDGCGDFNDISTWDIKELELHASTDWGHYTIYKEHGYQITPADGGPLDGYCTRDANDKVDCTNGLGLQHGQRLFTCKSSKAGAHAK
ncbi:unnamed protein product [Penicillium pancosmium]